MDALIAFFLVNMAYETSEGVFDALPRMNGSAMVGIRNFVDVITIDEAKGWEVHVGIHRKNELRPLNYNAVNVRFFDASGQELSSRERNKGIPIMTEGNSGSRGIDREYIVPHQKGRRPARVEVEIQQEKGIVVLGKGQ